MSVPTTKRALRAAMRRRRLALDAAWRRRASVAAQARVLRLKPVVSARRVGCYLATAGEVDTTRIAEFCWRRGKTLCVPAARPGGDGYGLVTFTGDMRLTTGPWGIPEPAVRRWVPAADMDAIIVPGVAFDRRGGRLGHGGGHFDRILAGAPGFKIGLAFEFQVLEAVPVGARDVRMNAVVTEKQTIRPPAAALGRRKP